VERKLDGRVAVVTGSSSGIGRAIAQLFAAQGARLLLLDVQPGSRADDEVGDTHELITAAGGEVAYLRCDVGREDDVDAAFTEAEQRYHRLDILVNCAGVFIRSPVAEVPVTDWQRVLDVNLTGYFLTIRGAVRMMMAADGGTIVNISSIHGMVGTGAAATYCSSKGGVENLTRQVAVDYGRHGIRCNAVAPGVIATAMSKGFRGTPEIRADYQRRTLLPRFGEPRDVAFAALYLASDEASFVTGSTLVVDGGWTCW
jgi:NAD(P)-dependent dehydrogenase (short-subunit alcohol dehydrogenase family)